MNDNAKKLTQLRRDEQEVRGYATSSRWYTGLSNAISFLERAETGSDPLDRFRDSWSAAYNLFMMYGKAGDDEFKCFNSWATELKEVPEIRRLLADHSEASPVSSFLSAISNAKNKLLKSQGLQELESWRPGSTGPEKVCRYFLTIARDMRNTCSHPEFNPSSSPIRRGLATAADCMIPVVASAIQAIIEHPVDGTTGKTTAYRSFLWPFLKNSDSFFSDYYLDRLLPEEELSAFQEDEIKTYLKDIAKSFVSKRGFLMTASADGTKDKWIIPTLFPVLKMSPYDGIRIVSGDAVFEPSYVLKREDLSGSPRDEYQGKDAGRDLTCLIWVLPWRSSLDVLSNDPAFEALSVMEVAHRALNSSDVPWAVITNGRQFRLLSRRTAHKPRCFLEMDLNAIIDRYTDQESLNAFRYLLGLFSGSSFGEQDKNGHSLLDRVLQGSERHGKEIGEELKQNVFGALEELGDGFLHYFRTQAEELEALRKERAPTVTKEAFLSSEELLKDIYTESLSLMYRLLFLFYAESRNMLPMEDEMYRETYSLESIRDDIISVHDDPDPKRFFGRGDTLLWDRLKELFEFVDHGWRTVIPVYNGGLFDTDLHEFLERFKVPDYFLARAIDLLSRTRPRTGQGKGEGRKKVTYRDLDVRHLGSIYEGILEYSAHIAGEDQVVMKRGSGGKAYEEYVSASDLKKAEKEQFKLWKEAITENPDNPKLPRGCNVAGFKEKGSYFLVFGGRQSKRKSSGSYYTPDYIVQYIVENTLGPLVRGECRPKPEPLPEALKKLGAEEDKAPTGPLSAEEILQLKVLDPAMGSGHFLVAATEYLARAYGEALVREGKNGEGVITDEEFIRYKRMIAERCIYGVDINPTAVELAKLSMWLFTMDRGRPLSFLNHHLKCGNSLIGAWIDDLGELPAFDKKGKPKKKAGTRKQRNLFEGQFRAKVPVMIRDLFGIMEQETLSYRDIKAKKALDKAVEEIKRPFKTVADAWVGTYFGEQAKDYALILSNVNSARDRCSDAARDHGFFHWELEFPEVFFDESGRKRTSLGFSAILGNPPWGGVYKTKITDWLKITFPEFHRRTPEMANYFLAMACVNLASVSGGVGMILPSVLFHQNEFASGRRYILRNFSIYRFLNLGENIFEGVTAPCGILVSFRTGKAQNYMASDLRSISRNMLKDRFIEVSNEESDFIDVDVSLKLEGSPFVCENNSLLAAYAIQHNGVPLTQIARDIASGIASGGDEAFRVAFDYAKQTFGKNTLLKPVLKGGDITEFFVPEDSGHLIIYSTNKTKSHRFPEIIRHLEQYKEKLSKKRETVQGKLPWYCLHWPRYPELFSAPKIVIRQTADTLIAAVDTQGYYALNSIIIIQVEQGKDALDRCRYIAGILNSKPIRKLYSFITQEENRVFAEVKPANLKRLRLPRLLEPKVAEIIDLVEKLEIIQKARVRIIRSRKQGGKDSFHQALLSADPNEEGKLSKFTREYRMIKDMIDETVMKGLSL